MASSELWPQRFLGPTQKSPVESVSQSAMPQAQLATLGAVPFVLVQVSGLEHVFTTDEHTNPWPSGAGRQSAVPHAQVAMLAAVPFQKPLGTCGASSSGVAKARKQPSLGRCMQH